MEDLQANGIDDFILVVSPDDRHITQYFRRESQIQGDVRFVYQEKRLGMADALRCASPLIQEDFILSACDNLTSSEHVRKMINLWQVEPRPNAILTLIPVEPERLGATGIVTLDGSVVTSIIEKPSPDEAPSNIASLPLYCFTRKFLEYLPQIRISPRGEYELQDVIQMLINQDGQVRGLFVDSRLALTSPADLLKINQHYLTEGNNQPQLQPQKVGANTRLITPLRIEKDTIIGEHCTIGPNVYIERGCQIGNRVHIYNAVLLRETIVPEGREIYDEVIS
jgi:bifunctional UDP-N-acetylglucosamine pyrophosphorylase/glucosamine-1-phosphate N-acetyltransferase